MSKEQAETVEITVPVRIRYSTPEGRARAIEWATEMLYFDGWSGECGGISAKRIKGRK